MRLAVQVEQLAALSSNVVVFLEHGDAGGSPRKKLQNLRGWSSIISDIFKSQSKSTHEMKCLEETNLEKYSNNVHLLKVSRGPETSTVR